MTIHTPLALGSMPERGLVVEHVVLVEDDPGDAFLVQELLAEAGERLATTCVRSLAEAAALLSPSTSCILLDLGLPDATGLQGLREVRRLAPNAAVVVLTGLADRERGVEAVAAGAQDYLVKGEVDGPLLARSIRYAVERKRADDSARRLYEAEQRRVQNLRLQRGLMPRPLLRDPALVWAPCYRPRGGDVLLGGDFFDAIELPDGSLRIVVGDVCGHGPDEAALGVNLRIAWRTLVLAGHPEDRVLPTLDDVLCSERDSDEVFATVCDLTVAADRRSVRLRLAGHPAPLCLEPVPAPLADDLRGPPIGVLTGSGWDAARIELEPNWSLLVYTDGLVEGRVAPAAKERLGIESLLQIMRALPRPTADPATFVDAVIARVEHAHGGPLDDDTALFLLAFTPDR